MITDFCTTIGWELQEAKETLQNQGADVFCVEVSSKKGVLDADELRIVRQKFNVEKNRIELTYSRFKTNLEINENE